MAGWMNQVSVSAHTQTSFGSTSLSRRGVQPKKLTIHLAQQYLSVINARAIIAMTVEGVCLPNIYRKDPQLPPNPKVRALAYSRVASLL